jgi:hypothetical protein
MPIVTGVIGCRAASPNGSGAQETAAITVKAAVAHNNVRPATFPHLAFGLSVLTTS